MLNFQKMKKHLWVNQKVKMKH